MYHFIRQSHLIVFLSLAVFSMYNLTFVYAAKPPKPLKGVYHLLGQTTCALDNTGLDETGNAFTREAGGGSNTFVVQGKMSYDGKGKGTFTGQHLGVIHNSNTIGSSPIHQDNLNCTITNTVNPGGTFTDLWECIGTPTAGPAFVSNQTKELVFNFQGVINDNKRKTLHYFNTQTIEETLLLKDNIGNIVSTFERICNRLAHGFKKKNIK